MEESVEVLSEEGQLIGKQVSKIVAHRKGLCHGISAVAFIDEKGRILLQRRSELKGTEPGKWDLSGAGHIDAHETPEEAAIRELYEELRIQVSKEDLVCVGTYVHKMQLDKKHNICHFTYLFLVRKNIRITDVILQESEVSEVRFFNKKDFVDMLNKNKMVDAMKHCHILLDYLN